MTIYQNVPLSEVLWYRIGGIARYVLECRSKEDILEAVEFIRSQSIPKTLVVGLGSNLLVSDEPFDGAIIRLVGGQETIQSAITLVDETTVEVFSGVLLDEVITYGFANRLCGLEWAGGLPGTVGAAVRGNVGAFGGEIKDWLISCEVLDVSADELVPFTISQEKMRFSYRNSRIKEEKNLLVISARFRLNSAAQDDLQKAKEKYEYAISYRHANHPLEYPSCGSTFKNITDEKKVAAIVSYFPDLKEKVQSKWHGKVAVASLIEKLQFSGFRIGNAQVSPKHANFIVNLGGASFSDVYKIIQSIDEEVYDTFGFGLEKEVEIVR